MEELIIDIKDPKNSISSAVNNFSSNEGIKLFINNDSSIEIMINSLISGNYEVTSNLFLGNISIFTIFFQVNIITKIVNARFNYESDYFFSKINLFVTFNLADDYDNLFQYNQYFGLKLIVSLNDIFGDVRKNLELIPKFFNDDPYIYRLIKLCPYNF